MRRMIPDNKWKKQVEDTQSLLNGYTSDNASTKKIYCHPITINRNNVNGVTCRLTMLIFNNSADPFTMTTLASFLQELGGQPVAGKLMVSGGFVNSTYTLIASYLVSFNNYFYIVGIDSKTDDAATVQNVDLNDLFGGGSGGLEDGVNPIN